MPGKARIAELHVSAPEGSTVSPCVLTASPSHGDPARDPGRGASGEKGGKACPCTDPGSHLQGTEPQGHQSWPQPRVIPSTLAPSPSKSQQRRERVPWTEPVGFGATERWESRGAGLATSTPGWELHPSQCQPGILTSTEPVPSTFILLGKHLIGIQSQPLLNSPTSYDLCDVFVFRLCCQQ